LLQYKESSDFSVKHYFYDFQFKFNRYVAISIHGYIIDNPILIEDSDDNDDEMPTLTVPVASEENQDCEESEESATDSEESATDFVPLPVAIPDLTQQSSSGTQLNDIGRLISSSTSVGEINVCMSKLENSEKYSLLFNHVKPCRTTLPSRFSNGCNRKFNIDWLRKYPWLRYSPTLDSVFCGPCSVLLSSERREDKGLLVNRPFSQWVKLSDTLNSHSKAAYHSDCLQAADILKATIENPNARIDVMQSTALKSKIEENKHILRQIVRAALFLGKQGLAFRGDVENVASAKNPGNFLALLKVFASNDPILQSHLDTPAARNATYISPQTQNEVINVIGLDVIRDSIIHEIKAAQFFSVMADEVSSHNIEHLALCIRYVDANCDIQEKFMEFVKLPRVRARDIATAIVTAIENFDLSLANLRGQGYDGASNMSGHTSGVQKLIRDKQPKAFYTHCAGHSLNLVIVKSCSVPAVRNCIAQIKSMTYWLKVSPKREGFFKQIVMKGRQDGVSSSRNPILNVCVTRWVENIDGWERFSQCHPFLIQLFEAIVYGNIAEEFEEYREGWTAEDKKDALAYLKTVESFEFVYTLIVLQRSLMYFKEASVKLQGKQQDVVSGFLLIEQCCSDMKKLRAKVGDYSARIYSHSVTLAEKSGISVSLPRITTRQRDRSNQPFSSPEEYFKLSVTIPFLDHLISEIAGRFNEHTKKASLIQHLLPFKMRPSSSVEDIQEAVSLYHNDLPNSSIVDEEYQRWKGKWMTVSIEKRPQSLAEAMKQCCPQSLPNIFTLLKLFATLPLSSCSCERSASSLRRLNNYLRCTQTEERLSTLALIHANYDHPFDIDTICRIFLNKHIRRLEHASVLFD